MIWSSKVQRMRSVRTKANKKSNKIEAERDKRKAKSYYDAGISTAEVIRKDIN